MSEFKKCSDCRFFEPARVFHGCSHYRNRSMRVVSDYQNGIGPKEVEVNLEYTYRLRELEDHCGPQAAWFEPKATWRDVWAEIKSYIRHRVERARL